MESYCAREHILAWKEEFRLFFPSRNRYVKSFRGRILRDDRTIITRRSLERENRLPAAQFRIRVRVRRSKNNQSVLLEISLPSSMESRIGFAHCRRNDSFETDARCDLSTHEFLSGLSRRYNIGTSGIPKCHSRILGDDDSEAGDVRFRTKNPVVLLRVFR